MKFMLMQNQDNHEHMAYWLTNTAPLVFLTQICVTSIWTSWVQKPPPPTSLFGRMAMLFLASYYSVLLLQRIEKWVDLVKFIIRSKGWFLGTIPIGSIGFTKTQNNILGTHLIWDTKWIINKHDICK